MRTPHPQTIPPSVLRDSSADHFRVRVEKEIGLLKVLHFGIFLVVGDSPDHKASFGES